MKRLFGLLPIMMMLCMSCVQTANAPARPQTLVEIHNHGMTAAKVYIVRNGIQLQRVANVEAMSTEKVYIDTYLLTTSQLAFYGFASEDRQQFFTDQLNTLDDDSYVSIDLQERFEQSAYSIFSLKLNRPE